MCIFMSICCYFFLCVVYVRLGDCEKKNILLIFVFNSNFIYNNKVY